MQAVGELLGAGCEVESAQVLTGRRARGRRRRAGPAGARGSASSVLTGSALVRTYADDAVVRAVLDALNRHLAG